MLDDRIATKLFDSCRTERKVLGLDEKEILALNIGCAGTANGRKALLLVSSRRYIVEIAVAIQDEFIDM